MKKDNKILFEEGDDWTFDLLAKFDELSDKYTAELGWDWYKLQIEIVSAEQMIELYSSTALPMNYNHWSFGRSYIRDYQSYTSGNSGLAYEICLNSNPSLCYNQESNDALMQFLVIAHVHAHSSHFKMNYLFRNNTDAENIVSYMAFARSFIAKCEEKYGVERVEMLLDMAHSLQNNGIDKYKRKHKNSIQREIERQKQRELYEEQHADYFMDSLVKRKSAKPLLIDEDAELKESYDLPEENILYFLEKHSPKLERWEREVLRIVRKIGQYFYPQMQGNILSEGTASFGHYYCITRAFEDGYISEGSYLQFLHSHSSVLFQWEYNNENRNKYNIQINKCQLNAYYFGFNLLMDIKRICENPTEEDKEWFPDIVGQDWKIVLKDAITNYRDESLIRQFLSPHLMRKLKLVHINYNTDNEYLLVKGHCDEEYYKSIRDNLADQYLIGNRMPEIEVSKVNPDDIVLTYHSVKGREIEKDDAFDVCKNIAHLYGKTVYLVDENENVIICAE